jgi:hypothetical protein
MTTVMTGVLNSETISKAEDTLVLGELQEKSQLAGQSGINLSQPFTGFLELALHYCNSFFFLR